MHGPPQTGRSWHRLVHRAFDALEGRWNAPAMRRAMSTGLIVAFLASIGLIELSRLGVLPTIFGHPMPRNPISAFLAADG